MIRRRLTLSAATVVALAGLARLFQACGEAAERERRAGGIAYSGPTGPDPTEAPPAPAPEVLAFWERPPVGYRWDVAMDSDGLVARKCLLRDVDPDAPIELAVHQTVSGQAPPLGYRWVADVRPGAMNQPNVIARLCLQRGSCQYSTYVAPDGTRRCSRPR
jgi:hypothetical protein